MMMVCSQVIGNDSCITWAGANGNFELNVMMPVMAHNLLESIRLLAQRLRRSSPKNASRESRRTKSVAANWSSFPWPWSRAWRRRSATIARPRSPRKARKTGRTVREICREKKVLPEAELNAALDPVAMTEPGGTGSAGG